MSLVPLCVGLLRRERASTTSHVTTAVGRVWSPDRGSATTTLFNTSSALLYPNSWIRSAPTLHHAGRSPALPNCPTRQPSLLFVEKRGMKSRSAIYFSTLKKMLRRRICRRPQTRTATPSLVADLACGPARVVLPILDSLCASHVPIVNLEAALCTACSLNPCVRLVRCAAFFFFFSFSPAARNSGTQSYARQCLQEKRIRIWTGISARARGVRSCGPPLQLRLRPPSDDAAK
jgi:hypothetical protein